MKKIIKTANAIVLDEQDRILLVKRAKNQDEGGMWSLPGGTLESTETTTQALEREMLEEIGCRLATYTFFQTRVTQQDENMVVETDYFVGRIIGTVKLDLDELSDFAWFVPTNLPNALAYGQLDVLQDYLRSRKLTIKS
jgi:8-oxo-dGTP diphosphatase